MKQGPHVLVILDGFGHRTAHEDNAIYQAHPEHILRWTAQYPHTIIEASGSAVGLLPHMIGNSEVGHLTLGSGRRIPQPVSCLSHAIETKEFFEDPLLVKRFRELKGTGKRLHLIGLLSDGGVHSHIDHLKALIILAAHYSLETIVHPFLDGRDVAPQTAAQYLTELEGTLQEIPQGRIGSLHGRFYAMDRDNHWERTQKSYETLTTPQKPLYQNWQEALAHSYDIGIVDEFFKPTALSESAAIEPGDALIFFNFRADRARQLTQALTLGMDTLFTMKPLELSWMITFTLYRADFPVDVLIHKKAVHNTLFDSLEAYSIPLFTIAETEKYAHVTYFFNGGREVVRTNETRILIPSKREYASYAEYPAMSAREITNTVLTALDANVHSFYLINFANADMVGHSGNLTATIEAIKILDNELGRLYTKIIEEQNGTLYITADHGKAEDMWDRSLAQPRTAHTTNTVPFLIVNRALKGSLSKLSLTELEDVAPFILKNLGLPVPPEMKRD